MTEKRELTKEELEDIEWEKAGFSRAEIEELDRRATRVGTALPIEEFFEIIEELLKR